MSVAGARFAPKGLFSMPRLSERLQLRRFLGSIRARLLGIVVLFGVALVAMLATLTWIDARDIYAGRPQESPHF